jgi:hypothetical protein
MYRTGASVHTFAGELLRDPTQLGNPAIDLCVQMQNILSVEFSAVLDEGLVLLLSFASFDDADCGRALELWCQS